MTTQFLEVKVLKHYRNYHKKVAIKRTKEKYKSNPNIRIEDSKNNIEIVKCDKYADKLYEMTRE